MKVLEPSTFSGSREAKEIENFLWDIEEYFKAAKIAEGAQVNLANMYLALDAKLWWHTRVLNDKHSRREPIISWESMKEELRNQFLSSNTSWVARESLKKLKQTGSIRAYIKKYNSLILDVIHILEEVHSRIATTTQ